MPLRNSPRADAKKLTLNLRREAHERLVRLADAKGSSQSRVVEDLVLDATTVSVPIPNELYDRLAAHESATGEPPAEVIDRALANNSPSR